jgi:hypothetical protein
MSRQLAGGVGAAHVAARSAPRLSHGADHARE